jgi:hypothetical protein
VKTIIEKRNASRCIFSILMFIVLCFAACGGDPEELLASSAGAASNGGNSAASNPSGGSSSLGGTSSGSSAAADGLTAAAAIPLDMNTWAAGTKPSDGEIWYRFTATASTHYVAVSRGTLTGYVRMYSSAGTDSAVGENIAITTAENFYTFNRTLTSGQTYYLRVYGTGSGSYQIMVSNAAVAAPITLPTTGVTQLTENVWADGNLSSSGAVQWYKFTATASTQYIHAAFGTLTALSFRLYTSTGLENGTYSVLNSITAYASYVLTVGQEYYICVQRYGGSGTYQIGFTASSTPPPITLPTTGITQLTENVWADGNLASAGAVQWYTFTATAATQYIHTALGTLANSVYIQVYASTGIAAGSASIDTSVSRTLTIGQEYYIRVWAYTSGSYTGTYQIALSASFITPGATVTSLTENTWTDGNLASAGAVQWYTFTATAATQFFHIGAGTLNSSYIQVYDSAGSTVGGTEYITANTPASRALTVGQEYYIKVWPYRDSYTGTYYTGTYRIAFSASFITPGATAASLTENVWADGNLASAGAVQWYTFTATAAAQYIHIEAGTLNYPYIQVYDSAGSTVGGTEYITAGTPVSRALTVGQEYYIRVRPYSSSYTGTYQIGFTASSTPPPITLPTTGVTQLTANTWGNGSLASAGAVQWFKFTATAAAQFIHTTLGTLTGGVYIQVYADTGTAVGISSSLGNGGFVSRTLTDGQEYYIRVWAYTSGNTGTYQIAYNTSSAAPPPLTAGVWANGSLTAGGSVTYTMSVTSGTTYRIWWNDSYQGNGTKSVDVIVSARYTSSGASIFSGVDSGWSSPQSFTANSTGTVTITVSGYSGATSGTFGVCYSTSTTRPST